MYLYFFSDTGLNSCEDRWLVEIRLKLFFSFWVGGKPLIREGRTEQWIEQETGRSWGHRLQLIDGRPHGTNHEW